MKKALFVTDSWKRIYDETTQREIRQLVDVLGPPRGRDVADTSPEELARAQVIFSGWGAPRLDAAFLEAAPRLEAFFYGAGSVRALLTEATWERNVVVVSAWAANARPVAEYTLAQILFCLKQGHRAAALYHKTHSSRLTRQQIETLAGGYGSVVGIVSLGMIGKRVVDLLKPFDIATIVYDPFLSQEEARRLGVTKVGLHHLFAQADVVSLHTPLLDATRGMITGELFASMKPGAAFINTARGAVVREAEMIQVLLERDDLFAVLDVTAPEPPDDDSPLWQMSNVMLTPHIAGSLGPECFRMGHWMLDELRRYLAGESLKWQITRQRAECLA